jgi:hypothetical protein
MTEAPGALRLGQIVARLHPWLQSRICAIRIARTAAHAWEAVLTYVPRTLPPPPDLQITHAEAAQPSDTHHPLALPSVGTEAALREQLRELADIAELGTLQVEKIRADSGEVGAQAEPAWRVTTHAGLVHQRRAWLSRIGRRDFGR